MIIGRALIFLGVVTLILTLISNYFDIELQLQGSDKITKLGDLWYFFSPNSLQMSETIISRYIDPCSALEVLNCSGFIWHPVISSLLLLPSAPLLAIITFIFIKLGVGKSKKKSIFNKQGTTDS